MREHTDDPCGRLLQEWQLRRHMVDSYHRSLRLLPPNAAADPGTSGTSGTSGGPGAPQRYRELRRELNDQLAIALLALRQASNHLRRCEEEHALTHRRADPPTVRWFLTAAHRYPPLARLSGMRQEVQAAAAARLAHFMHHIPHCEAEDVPL